MSRKIYLLLSVVLFLSACTGEEAIEPQSVIDEAAVARMDSTLQSFVETGAVAGTSALVYVDGREVGVNAVGHAEREAQRPVGRDTIAQTLSMQTATSSQRLRCP